MDYPVLVSRQLLRQYDADASAMAFHAQEFRYELSHQTAATAAFRPCCRLPYHLPLSP